MLFVENIHFNTCSDLHILNIPNGPICMVIICSELRTHLQAVDSLDDAGECKHQHKLTYSHWRWKKIKNKNEEKKKNEGKKNKKLKRSSLCTSLRFYFNYDLQNTRVTTTKGKIADYQRNRWSKENEHKKT